MLPDDYENLAQSVVASNFYGNNVLQAITTKDYWKITNEYKPLMHTWYLGVLMQYYVLMATVSVIISWIIQNAEKRQNVYKIIVLVTGVMSFSFFFIDSPTYRFYFLPSRLFEFSVGSIAYYLSLAPKVPIANKKWNFVFYLVSATLLFLLFADYEWEHREIPLIMTVAASGILTYIICHKSCCGTSNISNGLAYIGAASYSIFIWHQVAFAICRYSFTKYLYKADVLIYLLIAITVLSILSYKYIEQKIKATKLTWGIVLTLILATTIYSLDIYRIAGAVRDVPELDLVKGHAHRGMWAEYCDEGFEYNKEFANNGNPKWLVLGNSYGRDFINIIREGKLEEYVDLSYVEVGWQQHYSKRISEADFVFVSTLGLDESLVEEVKGFCNPDAKLYIVGEKNFGESNGQIYSHRFNEDYHEMSIQMEDGFDERNRHFKTLYGSCFIDLIDMVKQKDGRVRVFTDDDKFISQDCYHLTKSGARFYANHLNLKTYIN